MFTVLTCITEQHDLTLVGLAGLICFLASHCAMVLLDRATSCAGAARWVWLLTAGAAGGFGIWATHFVAMLAYDPGVVVGYHAGLTLVSLLVAIVATAGAVAAKIGYDRWVANILAGVLFGAGIASMHFTGMLAIEFPGTISWDKQFVTASIGLGIAFSIAAFRFAGRGERPILRGLAPTLLLTSGVVALHFTAMAGVTVTPGVVSLDPATLISPAIMVVTIAAVTFSLLAAGFAAAIFAVRSETKAARAERNFKLLVQGVTDYAIYMLDPDGKVSNWNAGAERTKGYSAEEVVGKDFSLFYSEEDRRKGLPLRAIETARSEGKFEAQGWRYRKDGSSFWAHVVIDAIHDEAGELVGFAKITKDNSKQKADADRIAEVTRNLDVALENMGQGICMFDKNERLVLCNKRYLEIFRFPEGSVRPGMTYREIVDVGYAANIDGAAEAAALAEAHYIRNMALIRSGVGSAVHKYASGNSIQQHVKMLANGGWVVTFEDITDRLKSEEQVAFLAKHDGLTGLPNRLQFGESVAEEMMIADRVRGNVAVIGIDLDKFKEVNDQHGHATGDKVLVELARRLDAARQEGEFIARFGGDEFAATKRFDELSALHDFIGRLEGALTGTVAIDGFEIKTGASLGVAIYPSDADSVDGLLANADLAMYRAKQSLLQRVCFYEAAMDENARRRRALANDLWASIDRNELHLHYQVQKSVRTGEITGYEVLLRWRHHQRGNIPPMDFIGLAEECGAILPIGEWVLREACREAASWNNGYKIAVNLSPVQLGHADMAAVISAILAETGLNPHRLEIEITESSIIVDKEKALRTMREIKALGVSIAIDDFGTGYSSLETLRSFPFDKIKLDKSFMAEVETSPQSKAIVRAILALGRSLEVPVLAEGVETQAQLDTLLEEQCDEAQGYLLGKPQAMGEAVVGKAA
ncbi:diguanylate cyclase (GGDEF)-like protein/PAS domain S-box-containing protein [Rhizobium binae]|uniref:Diguanylate cyclase (GGDEF)-like protein/PAS domain S-box-containing protein n=1 Tax=Rhizobium binae TaxID=1138190 RepID=A0ABV2M9W1_9HYPH|nr:EAL domain-containing protein [Rhizobium binae]MBX4992188.1 EAL domain-containing protein [Rhizobium binae]NKL51332.1 EAL domain-containing protein [Rhizobium leguminosarum bv. viciae]QSY80836.1 EAL domain-containing protein [Rhizobium binae]